MNKRITMLTAGLLVSFAPLLAAQAGRGPGRGGPRPMNATQHLDQNTQESSNTEKEPTPLTEQEQLALVQKMGLSGQGEVGSGDSGSKFSEEM